jgi:preprotein translocase subunit SecF
MEIIPPGTQIDFVRYRKIAAVISLGLILVGLVALFVRGGPNVGIDFAGGSLVHVRFAEDVRTADVRAALRPVELAGATIQDLGGGSEFLIRLPQSETEIEEATSKVTGALRERFGSEKVEILRVEAVGPRVGEALRRKGVLALAFATLMMGAYIWARFEWRFGLGAAVALLHDILIAVSALVVWNFEFDLTVIAALLTVVGYSVNDTVIVSDRIRENMRKDRRSPLLAIVNRSINETLSRTVLTTGVTLLVVVTLFVMGGNVIHGFAFTLLVGFIVGTYSSIFIASPVVLFFEARQPSPGRRT